MRMKCGETKRMLDCIGKVELIEEGKAIKVTLEAGKSFVIFWTAKTSIRLKLPGHAEIQTMTSKLL